MPQDAGITVEQVLRVDTWADKLARAVTALDELKSAGITVRPGSRLDRALSAVRRVVEGGPLALERVRGDREFHQGRYELGQAVRIVEGWRPELKRSAVKRRLRRMLSDPELPEDSRDETAGRDAQFELYVGGIYRSAGFAAFLDEPDLVLANVAPPLGIAAKRVKSAAKVETRARDAARQIEGSTLPGVVVLDLTEVVAARRRLWEGPTDSAVAVDVANAGIEYLIQAARRVRGAGACPWLVGVLGFVSALTVIHGHRALGDASVWLAAELWPAADYRTRALEIVLERLKPHIAG